MKLQLRKGKKAAIPTAVGLTAEPFFCTDTGELYVPRSDNTAPKKLNVYRNISTVSSSYTATVDDDLVICLAGTADYTLTLPPVIKGKEIIVKTSGNTSTKLTINPPTGATIDGQTSQSLIFDNSSITLVSNGTDYYII